MNIIAHLKKLHLKEEHRGAKKRKKRKLAELKNKRKRTNV